MRISNNKTNTPHRKNYQAVILYLMVRKSTSLEVNFLHSDRSIISVDKQYVAKLTFMLNFFWLGQQNIQDSISIELIKI